MVKADRPRWLQPPAVVSTVAERLAAGCSHSMKINGLLT
jgi:hypothetical protein